MASLPISITPIPPHPPRNHLVKLKANWESKRAGKSWSEINFQFSSSGVWIKREISFPLANLFCSFRQKQKRLLLWHNIYDFGLNYNIYEYSFQFYMTKVYKKNYNFFHFQQYNNADKEEWIYVALKIILRVTKWELPVDIWWIKNAAGFSAVFCDDKRPLMVYRSRCFGSEIEDISRLAPKSKLMFCRIFLYHR